ncbi:MAG TPA: transglutaminase-like domain-containing protein [Bacteroidales bacterium]|nr:transglutaminase-like domain-containing protein [Bacteroidales bacterium]
MKLTGLLIVILIISSQGCRIVVSNYDNVLKNISLDINKGNLKKAVHMADSVRSHTTDPGIQWKADSLKDIACRIPLDFPLKEDTIIKKLSVLLPWPEVNENLKKWESDGWLEYRLLEGEKRYFNRAASNLVRLISFHQHRHETDSLMSHSEELVTRKRMSEKIIRESAGSSTPVEPLKMEVVYTLTVCPDAVPDGETVRCWLPFPKENNPRQKDVYLTGSSNENFILAPDSCTHKTLYLEGKAEKGKPVTFRIAYTYISFGQYFVPFAVKPYNRNSSIFKKYTAEQPPQINFSPKVRTLADSIAGKETSPDQIVRKIFSWFNNSVPWTGAMEYSIMPDIPGYVISHLRGDCGMQTLLFMSMLRYKGIPCRWQSGWNMQPGFKNLHDWCEVYYEGPGWVPVDVEHKLQYSGDTSTREFYTCGIDPYRLIINDGISGTLYPPKKYLRSEPYDFQRGEVEWKGGNLYFDKWDYNMTIKYLNQ